MPEPNLLPINLNIFDINKLQSNIPELPNTTRINLMNQYNLDIRKVSILMVTKNIEICMIMCLSYS